MRHANRIVSLDLLRGVAATAVAIPHYLVLRNVHADYAEIVSIMSVEIFFGLSGFVLAPQIIACLRSQSLRNIGTFLVRRWMRTIPPYLVALVASAIFAGQLLSLDFVRYVFYIQNLFRQHNVVDFFPIAWSLSIEEWFYVTLPLLIFLLGRVLVRHTRRFELIFVIGFIAAVTLARVLFGDHGDWGADVRRVVVFRIDSIAYGFLFYLAIGRPHEGDYVASAHVPNPWLAGPLMLASIVGLFALAVQIELSRSYWAEFAYPFGASIMAIATIYFFYSLDPLIRRSAKVMVFSDFAGKISYAIYLFHILAAQVLQNRIAGYPLGIQLALYVGCIVAFCSAFYLYYERPILAARPRFVGVKSAAGPRGVHVDRRIGVEPSREL
jgi:peptidoglycan/LPS O-acetylase OafA/YrhL